MRLRRHICVKSCIITRQSTRFLWLPRVAGLFSVLLDNKCMFVPLCVGYNKELESLIHRSMSPAKVKGQVKRENSGDWFALKQGGHTQLTGRLLLIYTSQRLPPCAVTLQLWAAVGLWQSATLSDSVSVALVDGHLCILLLILSIKVFY